MRAKEARSTVADCDRRRERYDISTADDAWIELVTPDGRRWQLPLLEISESGIAFDPGDCAGGLPVGTELDDVKLRVGEIEIIGELRVSHVTSGLLSGLICGAQWHSKTGPDQARLLQLVDELAARTVSRG